MAEVYWGGRLRPKPARRRKGAARRAVLLLAGLLGGGLALWGGAEGYRVVAPVVAEWLAVREVRVEGLGQVTRGEVLERLALAPGETLLSVRPAALAERLAAHPWIKRATVTRVFPHTLAVTITERRPAAVVRAPAMTVSVDEEGHFLSVLPDAESSSLPVLVGVDPKRLLEGEDPARRAVRVGITVAEVLSRSFDGRPEVDVANPEHPVAYFNGLRFHFGASSVEEQWARYQQVEQALRVSAGTEGAMPGEEIDLRFPGKVIRRGGG